ncbi:calpain family cysteine protease containing protein [Stylonychia lemnae]|uniref:Calpain family cysteine protease containing protein n=1 Tax=Stylonychia lemnae TaxID=5949 RepID=A0A078AEE6_STYLE|nr:calpain family cysteine protease containing protein [Stylonychia lemnae]|eukprot:CDW79288.1 calpain family cysteine protease containing protein [Stylonychia lemnae]
MESQMFYDDEFPPNLRSLFNPEKQIQDSAKIRHQSLIWARISKIYPNYNVRVEKINPNNIVQGSLGNYDFIPINPQTNQPAFTQLSNNEYWPVILEKAWAKIHGCYENCSSGRTYETFSFLTGAPCQNIKHQDPEYFWKFIKDSDQQLHIISAESFDEQSQIPNFDSKDIVSNHAYSVILVKEVVHNNKKLRLMKLRNPWGKKEWKGDWSKLDQNWTPDLAKQFGLKYLKEGEFYMTTNDYFKYFASTSICKFNESMQRTSLQFTQKLNQITLIEFEVPPSCQDNQLELMLYQTSHKTGRVTDRYYENSQIRMIVGMSKNLSIKMACLKLCLSLMLIKIPLENLILLLDLKTHFIVLIQIVQLQIMPSIMFIMNQTSGFIQI